MDGGFSAAGSGLRPVPVAQKASVRSGRMKVKIRRITNEARNINSFELVAPDGGELPPFTAGAHIDLHLPGGYIRQYSLCNDPREKRRYQVGVLHLPDGRGGSKAVHRELRAGDEIEISEPRNNFQLKEDAARHLLIAGGIGVTPMMAMVERLRVLDAEFELHYCARGPEIAAFRDRLAPLEADGRVHYHFDGGDPSKGADLAALLSGREEGTHLYYCGPAGLMRAIEAAAEDWPAERKHCEYFAQPAVPTGGAAAEGEAGAFEIKLAKRGDTLAVPPGKTIVEVLREAGVEVETSCEAGLCGTCRTRYLKGEPEHNDMVLDDDEKGEYLMVCSARARSKVLILDI